MRYLRLYKKWKNKTIVRHDLEDAGVTNVGSGVTLMGSTPTYYLNLVIDIIWKQNYRCLYSTP